MSSVEAETPAPFSWAQWWREWVPTSSGGRLVLLVTLVCLTGALCGFFGWGQLDAGQGIELALTALGSSATHQARRAIEQRSGAKAS